MLLTIAQTRADRRSLHPAYVHAAVGGLHAQHGAAGSEVGADLPRVLALRHPSEIRMKAAVHGRPLDPRRIIFGDLEMYAAVGCRNVQTLPFPARSRKLDVSAAIRGLPVNIAPYPRKVDAAVDSRKLDIPAHIGEV